MYSKWDLMRDLQFGILIRAYCSSNASPHAALHSTRRSPQSQFLGHDLFPKSERYDVVSCGDDNGEFDHPTILLMDLAGKRMASRLLSHKIQYT